MRRRVRTLLLSLALVLAAIWFYRSRLPSGPAPARGAPSIVFTSLPAKTSAPAP